jgi:hypothetical protein
MTLARLAQAFELRLWDHQHPLRQFGTALPAELLFKMEDRGLGLDQLQASGSSHGVRAFAPMQI